MLPAMSVLVLIYLALTRRKAAGTGWLILIVVSWLGLGLVGFALSSTSVHSPWWGYINGISIHWLLAFAVFALLDVAEVGFAYAFLKPAFRREAQGVLILAVLFHFGLDAWNEFVPDRSPQSFLLIRMLGLALQFWAIGVFYRKARLEDAQATGWALIQHPPSPPIRAYRSFGLLYMFSGGFAILSILTGSGYVPDTIWAILLPLGTLIQVIFITLFITYSDQRSGFQSKLVGLTTLMILALLSIVGLIAYDTQKPLHSFSAEAGLEDQQTIRFTPHAESTYAITKQPSQFDAEWGVPLVPDSLAHRPMPIALPFPLPFFEQSVDTLYVYGMGVVTLDEPLSPLVLNNKGWGVPFWWLMLARNFYDEVPKIGLLLGPLDPLATGHVYLKTDSTRLVLTWDRVPAIPPIAGTSTFQLVVDATGAIALTYEDIALDDVLPIRGLNPRGGTAPPSGFVAWENTTPPSRSPLIEDYFDAGRRQLHTYTAALPFLVLFGTLTFLGFVTWMLYTGFGKPWQTLRAAIARVDAGELDTVVTINRQDEMGYLAQRFNAMTASLSHAEQQLRAYADGLETRVVERTAALEEALETVAGQAEKLQALDVAKSRFFANISHEFRTPLTLTLGPLDNLLEGVHGDLEAPVQDQLHIMRRNAQRLLHLINQLLDLSRLEAGGMMLQAREDNIVAFVKSIAYSFSSYAERQGITLEVDATPDTIPLYFDSDKLEKILSNLLSNAIKFTPANGRIRVRIREREREDGTEIVELSVRDSGQGIPEAELPLIFDRFHQAGRVQQTGTGIGLSLVKELVALHGGMIDATSEEGFGSTFIVRLLKGHVHLSPEQIMSDLTPELMHAPREDASFSADSPPEPSADVALPQASEEPTEALATLLIVDDNADVRAYLRTCLGPRYAIAEAVHGLDGLEQARTVLPDLILTDVMMPEMDGYAFCEALKADPLLNHIPVIMLTAKASDDHKMEGLELGADAYLYKPFHARELRTRVQNLIAARRLLQQRYSREILVQPSGVTIQSADEAFINQALTLVEAHLADSHFSVDALAEELGLSNRQLQRKFKALLGQSPNAFIRLIRLKRSQQLLEQGYGTVAEIAYAVGFNDPDYFSRRFQVVFGTTPSDYAEQQILASKADSTA